MREMKEIYMLAVRKQQRRQKIFAWAWVTISFLIVMFILIVMMGKVNAQGFFGPSYGQKHGNFSHGFFGGYGYGGHGYGHGYGYSHHYNGLTRCDYTECRGIVGTFHAHNGELHFRPYDPTDKHISTIEGGALGATGGAAVGGSYGGSKGASVGGVGGALLGGIIASKRQHNNCIIIGITGGGNQPAAGQPTKERERVTIINNVSRVIYVGGDSQPPKKSN